MFFSRRRWLVCGVGVGLQAPSPVGRGGVPRGTIATFGQLHPMLAPTLINKRCRTTIPTGGKRRTTMMPLGPPDQKCPCQHYPPWPVGTFFRLVNYYYIVRVGRGSCKAFRAFRLRLVAKQRFLQIRRRFLQQRGSVPAGHFA